MNKAYVVIRKYRDLILGPIARVLVSLKISANFVTILGLLFMIGVVVSINYSTKLSLVLFALGLLCDAIDGAVARVAKTQSDKGKFIDVLADTTTFVLVIFALFNIKLITASTGTAICVFMILSRILRALYHANQTNSANTKSDWLFKPEFGILPAVIAYCWYILFLYCVLFGVISLEIFGIFTSIILILDCCIISVLIMFQRRK